MKIKKRVIVHYKWLLNKIDSENSVTLIEMLVSIAVMGIIVVSLSTFLNQGINIWLEGQSTANIANEARSAIRMITRELKHVERKGISNAGSNTLTFEVDLNKDGNNEKIKYYVSGNNLKKKEDTDNDGDLNDAGYNVATKVSSLGFTYYDSSMTTPVSTTDDIRYVKVSVKMEEDISVSSTVFLRNYKVSW